MERPMRPSSPVDSIKICGILFLLVSVSLGALGAISMHLLTVPYSAEEKDPDVEYWLPWISSLGVVAMIIFCTLGGLCWLLKACLLDQRGCSGGGTFLRLGIAGLCIVPVLFCFSVPIYICFTRMVWKRLRMMEMEGKYSQGGSVPTVLTYLLPPFLFNLSGSTLPPWIHACYGIMLGSWFLHLIVIALCCRILSLLTCCYYHGDGFETFYEFDNPSILTFVDYYSDASAYSPYMGRGIAQSRLPLGDASRIRGNNGYNGYHVSYNAPLTYHPHQHPPRRPAPYDRNRSAQDQSLEEDSYNTGFTGYSLCSMDKAHPFHDTLSVTTPLKSPHRHEHDPVSPPLRHVRRQSSSPRRCLAPFEHLEGLNVSAKDSKKSKGGPVNAQKLHQQPPASGEGSAKTIYNPIIRISAASSRSSTKHPSDRNSHLHPVSAQHTAELEPLEHAQVPPGTLDSNCPFSAENH